jgi:transposase-like protein
MYDETLEQVTIEEKNYVDAEALMQKPQWFKAAAMRAEGTTVVEIARQLNVHSQTVFKWLATPLAKEMIERIQGSVNEATRDLAIANKKNRIDMAQREADRLLELIASRAAQSGVVAGDETGVVAVKQTTIQTVTRGGALTTTTIVEGKYEAAIHEQLRKLLEYVAREKGELDASVNVKHQGRVDHVHRRPNLDALNEEELVALAAIADRHSIDIT